MRLKKLKEKIQSKSKKKKNKIIFRKLLFINILWKILYKRNKHFMIINTGDKII